MVRLNDISKSDELRSLIVHHRYLFRVRTKAQRLKSVLSISPLYQCSLVSVESALQCHFKAANFRQAFQATDG